jgi:uncharacterized membrane protein
LRTRLPVVTVERHAIPAALELTEMSTRTVPAKQGARWIADGWRLFQQRPGTWIAVGLIELLVMLLLASIPFVGVLTSVFLMLWAGGVMAAADRCRTTGTARVADVIEGIRVKREALLVAGAILMLILFAGDLLAGYTGGADTFAVLLKGYSNTRGDDPLSSLPWAVLIAYVLVGVVGAMAMWLAPALIVLQGAAPVDALKTSFVVAWRNACPAAIYGLIVGLLVIAALITFGLGMLVVGPLIYLSTYAAYRDIFCAEP